MNEALPSLANELSTDYILVSVKWEDGGQQLWSKILKDKHCVKMFAMNAGHTHDKIIPIPMGPGLWLADNISDQVVKK